MKCDSLSEKKSRLSVFQRVAICGGALLLAAFAAMIVLLCVQRTETQVLYSAQREEFVAHMETFVVTERFNEEHGTTIPLGEYRLALSELDLKENEANSLGNNFHCRRDGQGILTVYYGAGEAVGDWKEVTYFERPVRVGELDFYNVRYGDMLMQKNRDGALPAFTHSSELVAEASDGGYAFSWVITKRYTVIGVIIFGVAAAITAIGVSVAYHFLKKRSD